MKMMPGSFHNVRDCKITGLKEGKRAFYIPSLFESARPGIIVKIIYSFGRPQWVIFKENNGRTIENYPAYFTTQKAEPYFIK